MAIIFRMMKKTPANGSSPLLHLIRANILLLKKQFYKEEFAARFREDRPTVVLTVEASGIITGHTMGEGDTEKVQRQGYTFLIFSFILGLFAALVILILSPVIVNYYDITLEAKEIAYHLMDAISLIIVFQAMSSILTKGVLRAGGDTTFLMAGDILFLWVASVPLGALAGLVFHWPAFWVYTFLKIDQIIKCFWCYFRLRSGKWLKKIRPTTDDNASPQNT